MERRNEFCVTCPHLEVDRDPRGWPKKGAVGYCRLRELPIENLEEMGCANHPERNGIGFEGPVGLLWIGDLPCVLGGIVDWEEEVGDLCEVCAGTASGMKQLVWRKGDQRNVFCTQACYLAWAQDRDPFLQSGEAPSKEDVAELRRLYGALVRAEEAVRPGEVEPIRELRNVMRFTEPALYRYLKAKHYLPKSNLDQAWCHLFRGEMLESREWTHPWILEIQLSLRELFGEPPMGIPQEAFERAYELARIRWARMVLGDLTEAGEGPRTPREVEKRFRGRHRPLRPSGTFTAFDARRIFFLERNSDLATELRQFFGAAQSHD